MFKVNTVSALKMKLISSQLQIWDTAGQERFRTITQSYYRSANGVIMAYDITKRSSYESLSRWLDDVKRYAGSNIVQILIGLLTIIFLGKSSWQQIHYENTPIQIYRKFHLQKLKIFS